MRGKENKEGNGRTTYFRPLFAEVSEIHAVKRSTYHVRRKKDEKHKVVVLYRWPSM